MYKLQGQTRILRDGKTINFQMDVWARNDKLQDKAIKEILKYALEAKI